MTRPARRVGLLMEERFRGGGTKSAPAVPCQQGKFYGCSTWKPPCYHEGRAQGKGQNPPHCFAFFKGAGRAREAYRKNSRKRLVTGYVSGCCRQCSGSRGEIRTLKSCGRRILSAVRLPFRHPARCAFCLVIQCSGVLPLWRAAVSRAWAEA